MTNSKRITKGLYEVTVSGRVFEVEDLKAASDGDCGAGWMLYEVKNGQREFWNDFATKRSAIAAIETAIEQGY